MKGLFTKKGKTTQPNHPGAPEVQHDGYQDNKVQADAAVSPTVVYPAPESIPSYSQPQAPRTNTTKRKRHTGSVHLNRNLPGPGKVHVRQACPGVLPLFFVEEVLLSGLQES